MLANLMTEAESGMASVERIKYYRDNIVPEESAADLLSYEKNKELIESIQSGAVQWPSDGRIDIRGVSMRYRDGETTDRRSRRIC